MAENNTTPTSAVPSARTCILHIELPSTSDPPRSEVLSFNPQKWAVVKQAASLRKLKKNFCISKYFPVIQSLPEDVDTIHGYHVHCYKNFTAVPQNTKTAPVKEKQLRSNAPSSPALSSTGVFPIQCIFCKKVRRKKGQTEEGLMSCETKQAEMTIKNAAKARDDNELLANIASIDFVAKEIKYHHSCRRLYINLAPSTDSPVINKEQSSKIGLNGIYSYVEKYVIENRRPEYLMSIYKRYLEMCEDADEEAITSAQNLSKNLLKKYESQIEMRCTSPKMGNVVFVKGLPDEAICSAYNYIHSPEATIRKAALILREEIKGVQRIQLPECPTLEDLKTGEGSPPDILLMFFRVLYGGLSAETCSPRVERYASSSSQDALFMVRKGCLVPSKQIMLGMALKSMSGSKKLVRILNRFGHVMNYHKIEQTETALGESIQARGLSCPEGTLVGEVMGLAFDNYDELTGTLSGAKSLHDTMGILYQNMNEEASPVTPNSTDIRDLGLPQRQEKERKRKLNVEEQHLEPYRKKPRVKSFQYSITAPEKCSDNCKDGEQIDLAWMMCHALQLHNIPMWVGFNSLLIPDTTTPQTVLYMKNINQPITSNDVIQETLAITQRCAQECKQQYGIVTYDLGAGKPAMQLQASESPKFDDVFIMLGPFHIQMAFFKAIGKFIDESGGPKMLTDTNVLAPGSLNGFISGKHFNRCKRLHPILALAFEVLHFQSFLQKYDQMEVEALLTELQSNPNEETWQMIKTSKYFKECVNLYAEYTAATRAGECGATAQFWMLYVDLIHAYHNLERAIRTNNVAHFIHALTPLIEIFFSTNHINYARWLTKYQLDLLNIDQTHPGLRTILEGGAFTVKRTQKAFSSSPVDLTLEQTINADAASRLTGIASMTNNYSARMRWMLTKSARSAIVTSVQEMAGIGNVDDPTAELRSARVKHDNTDVQKVIAQIQDTCNPFTGTVSESSKLFNISTGKAASESTKECLLEIKEKGKNKKETFVAACLEDPERFESVIKKESLRTFKNENVRYKCTKDVRITTLTCNRDLLGRLLILACKRDLDLEYLLSFPLTPVPLSMCSGDGMMVKTQKSTLLNLLEKKVQKHSAPRTVDACIIDGNFLLHNLPPNLPPTYGGLAAGVLLQATKLSTKRVDIVFDAYPIPSIKASERNRRGLDEKESQVYVITGAEQRRPSDIKDLLKARSFKEEFPKFIAGEWKSSHYVHLIEQRHVYLSYLGSCFHFYVTDGQIVREVVSKMINNHEEADTLIAAHAKLIDEEGSEGSVKNIVVRGSDTDIAVILLHHCWDMKAHLWMDIGTSSKNNRRYLNITSIANTVGRPVCSALPGFHAFTGCDYTSAFHRKGKVKPYSQMLKDTSAQIAFSSMSTGQLTENHEKVLKTFTAEIYGAKGKASSSLNEYRYKVFEKAYGPKTNCKNALEKLNGIDGSMLPPCEMELSQHIKRASFVARMWATATDPNIIQHPTPEDGWELKDGQYEIIWFDGPELPDALIPEDADLHDDNSAENFEISPSDEESCLSSDEE